MPTIDVMALTRPEFQDFELTERFMFLAKLRQSFLRDPRLGFNDLLRCVNDTIDEVEGWWLLLSPERKLREAQWVKDFFDMAEGFADKRRELALALLLRDYGIDEAKAKALTMIEAL